MRCSCFVALRVLKAQIATSPIAPVEMTRGMDQALPDLVLFLFLFFAFFREAVRFFYVFYIPAVFLGGERYWCS